MKMEDVIFRAMARKITWWQAAEILQIPESVMFRRLAHYKRRGYNPNWQRGNARCGPTQVRLDVAEKILALYQEKYLGLAPGLFEKRLRDVHGLSVNGVWLEMALRGAGLLGSNSSNYPQDHGRVGAKKARLPRVPAK